MMAVDIYETQMKPTALEDFRTFDLLIGACMQRKDEEDYKRGHELVKCEYPTQSFI